MTLIDCTDHGGRLTVFLKGHIDSSNAGDLEREIEKARTQSEAEELLLDASHLDYISSAGLRALFGAAEVMQENGDMCVINANDAVKNIFEITGFVDIIDVK